MVCELNPSFLQENFGSHAATHALLKGESFAQKSSFIRTQNWKPPNNKLMNDFFCNANISFNHFSKNAILLDPKIEDLKIPAPVTSLYHPTEVMVALNDDFSYLSSILVEPPLGYDINANGEEEFHVNDDHISLESDNNVDGGSVRNEDDESIGSTQRMENLAPNHNNTINGEQGAAAIQHTLPAETATTTDDRDYTLLNRWTFQREKNTIRRGIAPDPVVVSELSLLHLQHKHGLSLEAVKAVKEWAHSSYMSYPRIFDSRPNTRNKQLKLVREAMGIFKREDFQEIAIDWLPENKKRAIHVRPFTDCLYELLSNEELAGPNGENISLPHPTDPYSKKPDNLPKMASELHHGWWWSESMDKICQEKKEILVPIIGYMDGVATDSNGRLPVTPFNITLGIFNTETRQKPDAWTTILLYPDDNSEISVQKGTKSIHKLQNLHNCISVAFRELKELNKSGKSIAWRLRYDGKDWDVSLRFAFAYVIGDTEMHDKLCGR